MEKATKLGLLEKICAKLGKSIEDIEKIYSGKDHACRCGCSGRYFYPEEDLPAFLRALRACERAMQRNQTDPEGFLDTDGRPIITWVNLPYGGNNRCYTLYFKGA